MTAPLYCNTSLGGYGTQKEFVFKGLRKRWIYSLDTLNRLFKNDEIYFTKKGGMRKRVYLENSLGTPISNLWEEEEVKFVQGSEGLGYSTQKPIKLLDRIILSSSSKNEVVLDPFCGCGTTIESAILNERKWIGVDISFDAIDIIKERIKKRGVIEENDYCFIDGSPEN